MSAKSVSSFARDIYTLTSTQLFISVIAIGTSVVVARALGSEGRGQFALAVLFPTMLCAFTDFGMGTSGPRFVAARRWPVDVIFASNLLAGVARVALMAALGVLLIVHFREELFAGVPADLLLLGLWYLAPITVSGFILTLLLGLHSARLYSRLLLLNALVSFLVLTAAWLIFGLTPWSALFLELIAGTQAAILIFVLVLKKAGGCGEPSGRYLGEAYRYGFGVYASNVTLFLNGRIVWLLINGAVGPVGVGLYTVAQTATERIYLLADALGTLLLPRVAEDPERNSMRLTPVVFRIAMVTAGLAAVCLAAIAVPLVQCLFSDEFSGAVPVLRVLLVAVVLSSGWRVIFQDLNARGRSTQTAIVNACAAVAGLLLAAILLPRIGLAGAAWAAVGSAAISFLCGIWLFGGGTQGGSRFSALFTISTMEREAVKKVWRKFRSAAAWSARCGGRSAWEERCLIW